MNRDITILTHLQKNVAKQFGKQIRTATDCDHLSILFKRNLNAEVSSQTLRRFFGLIKSSSNTSHFTLDLISKYCGYRDFNDFRQSYNNLELEIFFSDEQNLDQNYWEKSEQLCKEIIKSPELLVNTCQVSQGY
jgi:RNA recognition motif-containing protein